MRARRERVGVVLGVGLVGLMMVLTVTSPTAAQNRSPAGGAETRIAPSLTLTGAPATARTWAEMAQAEATRPAPPARLKPFRPTMALAAYGAAKADAAAGPRVGTPAPAAEGTAPQAPPTLKGLNCNGVNQSSAGMLFPPDTHGAVGHTQYVQIVNSHLRVYTKAPVSGTPCPTLLSATSLAALFGYFTETLFDPRVIYDHVWRRWVVTADALPQSDGHQFHFIAISQTPDALGPYFVYPVDVTQFLASFGADFWDFPQLGMDRDAIIVTANLFSGQNFVGAAMFAVTKPILYNGLGFEVSMFGTFGGFGTVAPPIVVDRTCDAKTLLVIAPINGTTLKLYTLHGSCPGFAPTLTGPVDVDVTDYSLPPNAPQPGGTGQVIDTSDNRFVNASTQVGDNLYQVHTINLAGRAASRFYRINTATNTLAESGTFSATGTSHDFNASIAADTVGDVYVTWSSTDPANGVDPQVRVSGKQAADVGIPSGVAVFTSPAPLTENCADNPCAGIQRWGDYSAITINPQRLLDPSKPSLAFGVNERVNNSGEWSSRIFRVGIP